MFEIDHKSRMWHMFLARTHIEMMHVVSMTLVEYSTLCVINSSFRRMQIHHGSSMAGSRIENYQDYSAVVFRRLTMVKIQFDQLKNTLLVR